MQIPLFGNIKFGNAKNPRSSYWIIGLLAAGVLAVPVIYTLQQRNKPQSQLEALTIAVQREDVTQQIRGSGTVQPIRTVNVSPKTAGRIVEILVDQGDRVQQGQLLARMDDKDVRAERDQAAANLAAAEARLATLISPTRTEAIGQAQAGVERAKGEIARARGEVARAEGEVLRSQGAVADAQSQLEFAGRQLQRQQALATEGAISANSLDEFARKQQTAKQALIQAQAQVTQAQAQVEQAQAQVAQAEAGLSSSQAQRQQQNTTGSTGEIAQAQAQAAAAAAQLQAVENRLQDTEIRAPFAGLITQRYATIGAFVTPTTQASAAGSGATSTSVFALASKLEVLAEVPERDISQIKKNQAVNIQADAYPKDTFQGKVRLIAPEAVEEQSVTKFQVRVDLETGLDKLRSGMNVDLNFAGGQLKQVLQVPAVAIVTKRGRPGVLVPDKDGKPSFKPVKVGADLENRTQILEGLEVGDRIFKELPPGQKLDQILKEDQKKP